MSNDLDSAVTAICRSHAGGRARLMDIARTVQRRFGCVSDDAMRIIARELHISRVEVKSFVSFYPTLSIRPRGPIVIRVCDDIVDRMFGADLVIRAFSEALGIEVGQTTPDGQISLETTSCIGMSDQAPAALVNDVVVTELSTDKAHEIVRALRTHMDPKRLVRKLGDGNNAHDLVHSMVNSNIRQVGPLIFSPIRRGEAVQKALSITPVEVIRAIKTARLRGRGGLSFPTGMKWEFARAAEIEHVEHRAADSLYAGRDYTLEFGRAAQGERKYIICNANEGEPGTFKDRVILTERPDRLFAGMTIAGYAVGATEGILYLRPEYAYLHPFLEHILEKRREDGLLGDAICNHAGFNFDIRIQVGGGAYVCGEETALINSCQGLRGEPRNRPPFPVQEGYLGFPTVVNNVETFCCVSKILHEGSATFSTYGTSQSSGTKLLSVAGDCMRPGIFELPFGVSLRVVLELAGADDAMAVQLGGPSGELIGPDKFDRLIFHEDLATGGAVTIFGPDRDILEITRAYTAFFVQESCGYCAPCRVGTELLRQGLERPVLAGTADAEDLAELERIGYVVRTTSRCGLGQCAPNPILSSLKNFRAAYEGPRKAHRNGDHSSADAPAVPASRGSGSADR